MSKTIATVVGILELWRKTTAPLVINGQTLIETNVYLIQQSREHYIKRSNGNLIIATGNYFPVLLYLELICFRDIVV